MDRALLIGIDHYRFIERGLLGCVNDVRAVKSFLIDRCRFSGSSIRTIPEEEATGSRIVYELKTLVAGIVAGDRVVFHFSGHGAQFPTFSQQNEPDGLDEMICPVDFRPTAGNGVRDRDFRRIFAGVPPGVGFVWISDSCCSGDLALLLKLAVNAGLRHVLPPEAIVLAIERAKKLGLEPLSLRGAANQLNLVLLSACRPNGTAHETSVNGESRGLFTALLLNRLSASDGFRVPLRQVISDIERRIRTADQIPDIAGSEANKNAPFPSPQPTPVSPGASPRNTLSASSNQQEENAMSTSTKNSLCLGTYKATRLATGLVFMTAEGEHKKSGFTQTFQPVDVDTFQFTHVEPSGEEVPDGVPFTATLTLRDFRGEVIHIQDAFGEIDVPIEPTEASPAVREVLDPLGRGLRW
jgi:metacaspase-1